MKIKNPIRTYLNWYGRNCVEISEETAGRAIAHYGKFSAQLIAINIAVFAVTYGAVYGIGKIKEKIQEKKKK